MLDRPCGVPDIKAPTAALMLSGRRISDGNLGHSRHIGSDALGTSGSLLADDIGFLDLQRRQNVSLRNRRQLGRLTLRLHEGHDVGAHAAGQDWLAVPGLAATPVRGVAFVVTRVTASSLKIRTRARARNAAVSKVGISRSLK